jgi:hypothetical protein
MVAAPWYVAAGWALELFTTNATREHHDVDVFREPYSGDRWVCRRNPSITMSYDELILLASSGIPYVIPEVALVFKASQPQDKDEADVRRVLPAMDQTRRSRLTRWLAQTHPDHRWLELITSTG